MNEQALSPSRNDTSRGWIPGWRLTVVLLALAFALRLAFGLLGEFWADDERQIFLIGLKYYTTGAWPYFGPDIVYTQTQIPGGLQGLLIAAPLWVVAQPEAPYVLLNLLSMGSLCLLGWYVSRRVPHLPAWFLWPWVLFCPWTLNLSTHITNPSYALTSSVLFGVAVFELVPALSTRTLPPRLAFFLAGFALLWEYQIQMSFVLMLPFVALVFGLALRDGWRRAVSGAVWFSAGALLAGLTLLPTLFAYGLSAPAQSGANIRFVPVRLLRVGDLVGRFLSLGAFEIPRFLGPATPERLAFLARYPLAAPFIVFAGLGGLAQTVVLFMELFRRWRDPLERPIRWAMVATLGFMWVVFAFSVKGPASHVIYITLPLVMVYSCMCWARLLERRPIRIVAAALLVSGVVTHAAIAVDGLRGRSLYTNRPLVVRAIQEKNDRLLGERRPVMWEAERAKR